MRDVWGRWRRYFQELEDALRVAGKQLEDADRELREDHEYASWPQVQKEGHEIELLRRASDVPWLAELIRIARDRPDAEAEGSPGERGMVWKDGVDRLTKPSGSDDDAWSDADPAVRAAAEAGPGADEAPPSRLRAAERALRARTRSIAVLTENLINPRNAAAIARSVEFFGIQSMHLVQRDRRIPMNKSITRSCDAWLDLAWYAKSETAIEVLKGEGYAVWVADFDEASVPLERVPLSPRIAVCFGSEQLGVSPELRAAADGSFHVPGDGFTGYLNVSTASAIALASLDRRMRAAGLRAPLDEEDRRRLRRAWFPRIARGQAWREREYARWIDSAPTWTRVEEEDRHR